MIRRVVNFVRRFTAVRFDIVIPPDDLPTEEMVEAAVERFMGRV